MISSVWQDFIRYMFKTTTLDIPTTFHKQVLACKEILDYDYSSLITSIFDFAVNVADVDFKFETGNENLTKALNNWKENLNDSFDGRIPTGLKELAKEYFKERWTSSLIVMNGTWQKDPESGLLLPSKLWIMDSSGINVRGKGSILGNFSYWVKIKKAGDYRKLPLDKDKSFVLIQKPHGRWYDKYPVPYLVRKGTLVSYLIKKALKENSGKVLDELIPYLILLKKGTERLFLEAGIDYDDAKMKELRDRFKAHLEKKKQTSGYKETGVYVSPFDVELQEFIPDLKKVFAREIYIEIDRDILASLGLIEVIEGIGTTRREAILNPGPFREEVKQGVEDFKSMLADLIRLIIEKNKAEHRKWMKTGIKVSSTPIKGFFSADMLAYLRSMYDRGLIDKQTTIELPTQLDYQTVRERRIRERKAGDDEIMHPPVIINKEEQPKVPDFTTPEEEEVKKQKKKSEKEIKSADELKDQLEITCQACGFIFDYLQIQEQGMGYAKCPICNSVLDQEGKVFFIASDLVGAPYTLENVPQAVKRLPKHAQSIWINAWNNSYRKWGETRAFKIAWGAVKKLYKKVGNTWVRKKDK